MNQPGGRMFFDLAKYMQAELYLQFINFYYSAYGQRREPFEPEFFVLDVLMFNTPEQVRAMLDDVTSDQ